MPAPVYYGGAGYRSGEYNYRSWAQSPESTGNSWLGPIGSWFDGMTPPYVGQPAAAPVGCGSPVYLPAPQPNGNGSAGGVNALPPSKSTVAAGLQR